ncbi:MAG: ATP-dependent 6-phosphofructokinase [Candidatus Woesearchaeota archaeon]
MRKRILILTGGGDVPGLNNLIKWSTKSLLDESLSKPGEYEVIGIKHGFKGLLSKDIDRNIIPLDESTVRTWDRVGGTNLGSGRDKLEEEKGHFDIIEDNLDLLKCYAVEVVGGNDHMGYNAYKLYQRGIRVVGVPKTIDGDVKGTEKVIGISTAIQFNGEMINRLKTTAGSHNMIFFYETMGRKAGWLALKSAIAGQTSLVLVPEFPFRLEALCRRIQDRRNNGHRYDIIVISEGAKIQGYEETVQDDSLDAYGNVKLGGISALVANLVKKELGYETRHVIPGHLQRGGTPNQQDLELSMQFGIAAAQLIKEGNFGNYVVFRHGQTGYRPLEESLKDPKLVSLKHYSPERLTYQRTLELLRL